jgi:hypothetical protein
MIHNDEVKKQLVEIGATNLMWGRAELRELPKILFENERLRHVLNGRYEGGFAVLCATDQRVILIDKKPFFLTLEDTRYEMISDVQFNHRLIDASIWIGTVHKRLTFRAYHHSKLRSLTNYIQEQVMVSRGLQSQQSQSPVLAQDQPQLQGQPAFALAQQHTSNTAENNLPIDPVKSILSATNRSPINPYKMPVMIRHRVSRFY